MDHSRYVVEARLADEVIRPVALRLDRAVVAKVGVFTLGLEPVVAQLRIRQVVEMNVRVCKWKRRHSAPFTCRPRKAGNMMPPLSGSRVDPGDDVEARATV